MTKKIPDLSDLYQLATQLELDKDLSLQELKARDHSIGMACDARKDSARLLFWLQQVAARRQTDLHGQSSPRLSEATAAFIARLLALLLGSGAMMSLLLSSGRGLVNVFVFVLVFVVLQFVMSVFSAWALYRTVRGNAAVVLPVSPARLLMSRIYPDPRYFREMRSVLRLAFLRYGQEMGALFTIGAMCGFVAVLALSDFSFVWGSTFELSNAAVVSMTEFLSLPWSGLMSMATVDAQVIADSRYHAAQAGLGQADIERMRGWWPFLFMSLVCYALLPRVLLWVVSGFCFRRSITASFATYPRSDLVLSRMRSPLVQTQGAAGEGARAAAGGERRRSGKPVDVAPDGGLFLVNWAQTLAAGRVHDFQVFAAVPPGHIIDVGIGSLAQDIELASAVAGNRIHRLLVVVKSWEPPMADLADFLAHFNHVGHCTLYPLALPGKPVAGERMADWRKFSRALPFDVSDVCALEDA